MPLMMTPAEIAAHNNATTYEQIQSAIANANKAPEELLAERLAAKYPKLNITTMPRDPDEGDENAPAVLVTFGETECGIDPFSSYDGRSPADPRSEWGLQWDDAIAIRRHNRITLAVREGNEEVAREPGMDTYVVWPADGCAYFLVESTLFCAPLARDTGAVLWADNTEVEQVLPHQRPIIKFLGECK